MYNTFNISMIILGIINNDLIRYFYYNILKFRHLFYPLEKVHNLTADSNIFDFQKRYRYINIWL